MPIIGIPLLGKGSTNHLHRQEVVDAMRAEGMDVLFVVRDDYQHILNHIPGCVYASYAIPRYSGVAGRILDFCQYLRFQYPSSDPWRVWRHATLKAMTPRFSSRVAMNLVFVLARYKWVMRATVSLEGLIYGLIDKAEDLKGLKVDKLLMLGVGTSSDPATTRLSWWAIRNKIPALHFVGNYDGLSSKGYRGFPVAHLAVWGEQMKRDAIVRHDVPENCITMIGALRYNQIPPSETRDRNAFFNRIGLDPAATTIAFAGSSYDFHYFEMLSAFKQLKQSMGRKLQLIMRIYPDKNILDSAYVDVLMDYAGKCDDVRVSVGDPKFKQRTGREEVLQIDEDDLWNILEFSAVVVNIYSTLTLEACIFDKRVINMWYFHEAARALKQPIYFPYPLTQHIRRVEASGAVTTATSRKQLIEQMADSIANPDEHSVARRNLVIGECGILDGKAVQRLSKMCLSNRLNKGA